MIHTIQSLKNGIELLDARQNHFIVSIAMLQEQINKYQKEVDKLEYQITKTKELLDERIRIADED